jgi:hypothetical protein
MSRMQRLKRVFAIEIERCRRCGGRLTVIASIEEPALIERILAHVRQRDEEDRLLPLGAQGDYQISTSPASHAASQHKHRTRSMLRY